MKFPKLQPPAPKTLKVPDLAGGLNLRDGVSEVLDNQLTQAKNVWWQDGVLKTRPGVYIDENQKYKIERYQSEGVRLRNFPNIKKFMNGEECILQVGEHEEQDILTLEFFWTTEDRLGKIGKIDIAPNDYLVTQNSGVIYVFFENGEKYKCNYLLNEDFVSIEDSEIYAPIVLTECKPINYTYYSPKIVELNGLMYEPYNLIGNAYRVQYTAFNPDIAYDDGELLETHKMKYLLPEDASQLKGKTIKVKLTTTLNEAEHQVTFSDNIGWPEYETDASVEEARDGFRICCAWNYIWFSDEREDPENITLITEKCKLRNNIEITIPYIPSDSDKNKVYKMTKVEWFGGGTEGIAGGTRLFLGGNTAEANKNLVVWSDLNNPLYFPENNYFRVGESSSAVTGFGRQADMLVIFKENGSGIYYTKYQQNGDITAEDLINQSVVDYVASSVYFPLVQVNPNVGCSYPETIQLCRNRLVWLGDNGNVYTLVNESQYNERSVFCVSEMVRRDLRQSVWGTPTACDWNGFYCLMCGNKLYLMDYNCYGYTHVYGYSKTEDANVRIPWYIWELPIEGNVAVINKTMLISLGNDGCSESTCCFLNYVLSSHNSLSDIYYGYTPGVEQFTNENRPIQTNLRTKLFAFGEPNTHKIIDKINLQLGNNGGERITVKVITDQSEEEHDIYLNGTQTEAYTPGYIDSKAIFPCARNVLRIGLEISSEGVVAVDGMEIKYRTTGGAR